MTDSGAVLTVGSHGKKKLSRIRPWVMLVTPLVAILFQVYVPLYIPLLQHLELPLLVTLYFGIARRSPIGGALIGAGIGLVQDSLSYQPIGILGIVKTLIGYAAASLGVRLDTGHQAVRFSLGALFFLVHQLLYGALRQVLLGAPSGLDLLPTLAAALANGVVTIPLFYVLDRLKEDR